MKIVYLNGEYIPITEAKISVMDRGFIFGDGIYEVVPVYQGKALGLGGHLKRLKNSLEAVKIDFDVEAVDWQELVEKLVDRNGGGNQSVYIQITRGVQEIRNHSFEEEFTPTLFVMSSEIKPPSETVYREGVAAISLVDNRWDRCQIKSTSLQPNVLLRQQATDVGAAEAILIRDGVVTEGAASNVFVAWSGKVYTAPKSMNILAGITRDFVVDILKQLDIPFCEEALEQEKLRSADEIWLTSSTKEMLPVTMLNGQKVRDGQVGKLYKKVMSAYQANKQNTKQNSLNGPA